MELYKDLFVIMNETCHFLVLFYYFTRNFMCFFISIYFALDVSCNSSGIGNFGGW